MAELAENGKDEDLPDTVSLTQNDLDYYWNLWTLWRGTDRRFLPSQLLAEPERPLRVMLELDGIYAIVERQIAKQEKAKENG